MRFELSITNEKNPKGIVFLEESIFAFRCYERLSGLDSTLDRKKVDLRSIDPHDESPLSPFDTLPINHDPFVFDNDYSVSPPYYFRILIEKDDQTKAYFDEDFTGATAQFKFTDLDGKQERFFRGIVLQSFKRKANRENASRLELCCYPHLWALRLSQKSRVWENTTGSEVLESLREEYLGEVPEFPSIHKHDYSTVNERHESNVQWSESDFEFMSRLLERDGKFYTFSHSDLSTTLHLCSHNAPGLSKLLPEKELRFEADIPHEDVLFGDTISAVVEDNRFMPKKYSISDYNPLNEAVELHYEYEMPDSNSSAMEVYDYPAQVSEVSGLEETTGRRINAMTAQQKNIMLASKCPFVSAGHLINVQLDFNREKFVSVRPTQVVHELVRNKQKLPIYRNWFNALDSKESYAPTMRTPIPKIAGTHNAIVVTRNGYVADVDDQSRALIVFRWDKNKTPVRARLGQPWAGSKHGMNVLPRDGDEVLVGFIQGNTDRPVVMLSLHNSTTRKKFNPTQVMPLGMQGSNHFSNNQQNTTALHNSSGNTLTFSDVFTESEDKIPNPSSAALVKMSAEQNFILEIGKKFEAGKWKKEPKERGVGLIRSYGDLNIVVGKKKKDDSEPGAWPFTGVEEQYNTSATDTELIKEDEERGGLNINVMGELKTRVSSNFDEMYHPATGALIEVSYRLPIKTDPVKSIVEHSSKYKADIGGFNFHLNRETELKMVGGLNGKIELGGSLNISDLDISIKSSGMEKLMEFVKDSAQIKVEAKFFNKTWKSQNEDISKKSYATHVKEQSPADTEEKSGYRKICEGATEVITLLTDLTDAGLLTWVSVLVGQTTFSASDREKDISSPRGEEFDRKTAADAHREAVKHFLSKQFPTVALAMLSANASTFALLALTGAIIMREDNVKVLAAEIEPASVGYGALNKTVNDMEGVTNSTQTSTETLTNLGTLVNEYISTTNEAISAHAETTNATFDLVFNKVEAAERETKVAQDTADASVRKAVIIEDTLKATNVAHEHLSYNLSALSAKLLSLNIEVP